jgi:hypothetical protein
MVYSLNIRVATNRRLHLMETRNENLLFLLWLYFSRLHRLSSYQKQQQLPYREENPARL